MALSQEARLAGTVSVRGHRGEDISKAIAKVKKAGGKAHGKPMDIPNVESDVSFLDPEGNRVSMLEPIPMNWHGLVKRPTPKRAAKKTVKKRRKK